MTGSHVHSIFYLGLAGYIGGAVAARIRKQYPDARIVAYTRSRQNAPAFEKFGVQPLIGSGDLLKDLPLIEEASANAEVVINTADADGLELAEAVLAGLQSTKVSVTPILLHTSGTGVVMHGSAGAYDPADSKIWDDAKTEDIQGIDPKMPHRNVDLALFKAQETRKFIVYIIAPSTIYGVAHEAPLHQISQQIPNLVRAAVKNRQAVYAGPGSNHWNNVQVDDLVDLYLLILRKSLQERETGAWKNENPYARFFWGSARPHIWGDIARALGPLLHRKGLVDTPEAKSLPPDQIPRVTASNSQTVANRGFAEGWKPSRGPIEDYLDEDVEATVKQL